MIYTFDISIGADEPRRVQCGLFTSDDLAGLPGETETERCRAYAEHPLVDQPPGSYEMRLWHAHLEPWSLLDSELPDETWTVAVP